MLRALRRQCVAALATALGLAPLAAQSAGVPGPAPHGAGGAPAAVERALHAFEALTISPDGARLAAVESDAPAVDGAKTRQQLVLRRADGTPLKTVALPCAPDPDCVPSQPVWAPDGKHVVFILRSPKAKTRALESVDANGTNLRTVLVFDGVLNAPRFAGNGTLAVLATAGARKEIGATAAGAPVVGEIGARPDEQRIAIVAAGHVRYVSPADLFVYEYDWRPDGSGFVGTAARGNGDDNWWIAKLYAFDAAAGDARVIYTPSSAQQQLADPRVSPDGRTVAFIGGIMSDFGSTGGDVFILPLAGGSAVDLTLDSPASATSLAWEGDGDLLISELRGANEGIAIAKPAAPGTLPAQAAPKPLWSAPVSIDAADAHLAVARAADRSAVVMEDFEHPPEIAVGQTGHWQPVTHANAGLAAETRASTVSWKNDGFDIDGWLLAPAHTATAGKHPLITVVHGGPSAAYTPRFIARGTTRRFLRRGYYVFLPNPRGSFGEGERFTLANVKDFGYGDLRDILTGIDAVEKQAPVDDARLGLTGYSYGGYMTMWTVTQTNRFKAAVAGAGVSDWLSYYGENGIDQWMIPFFGASVYDDPAVYAKSSPLTFIKNVKTPTFEFVGENDVECPAPQTQEFWHALQTFGVPTQFVVYPGEGHGLRGPAHRADAERRTLAWFDRYLR